MKKVIVIFTFIFISAVSFSAGFLVKNSIDNEKFRLFTMEQNNLHRINNKLTEENKFLSGLNTELLNNINPIDKKENECLNKAHTAFDSLNCCYEAEKDWDNEIIKYLNLLKKNMNADEYKLIKNNNDLWKKQNKNDNEIINTFIFNHGGTIYYQLAADDYVRLKKQRAEFLKWIYSVYIDDTGERSD